MPTPFLASPSARLSVLLPAVLALSAPDSASGQARDTTWGRPRDTTNADFRIDARQGTSQSQRTFRQDASVRIVLTDVNPFVFNYRVESRGQSVAEASPASFFHVALGLELPKAADTKVVDTKNVPLNLFALPLDSFTVPSCSPPADDDVAEGAMEVGRLTGLFTSSVRGPAEALAAAIAEPNRQYKTGLSTARNSALASGEIRNGALAAHTALLAIVDAYQRADDILKPAVDEYTRGVRTLRQSLDDLIEMHPTCLPLRRLRIDSRTLAADTLWAKNLVATVSARRAEAQQVGSSLAMIANEPRKFYVILELPRFRGPTDVEVTVSRQPLTASLTPATAGTGDQVKPVKFDTVGRHQLNVGGRGRLSAATGVTWGQLPERTYNVVQRSVPTIDGSATSTASFVVRTKDSPERVVPMLFLNANVCNRVLPRCSDVPGELSFHAVFGVTPKALALARFDYFAGVGLGLLGERLYVNAGLFIAPLERLNGDIPPGGQLPAGQTAVSTYTMLARRFGAALSYRVAPW